MDVFKPVVTADGKLYGVPFEAAMGGGIFYNTKIYDELGLSVPKTWDEFMANNAKIKAAGKVPVAQTYRPDTWTSQLFVLADFYNVLAEVPTFADDYTANKAKYATTPAAVRGFQHLEDAFKAGYFNEDFGAASYDDGLRMIATGEAAHYPMLTFAVGAIQQNHPENLNDVGFFAQPGPDAAKNGLTVWMPAAFYIPAESENIAAAKDFLNFVASPEGCDVITGAIGATGPYMVKGCELPADVPTAVGRHAALLRDRRAPPRRRSSSSRRSRARRSSRSPSRSAPAFVRPRTAPRSTTRTSRSRPSSSGCRAGDNACADDGPVPRKGRAAVGGAPVRRRSPYPYWFVLPGAVVFTVFFLVPTVASFWFSLTRWDLFTAQFIGLENFRQFFSEPFLLQGLVNTLIYAAVTSGTKTVIGLLLAVLLTSGIFAQGFLRTVIFFPVLVSFIGVGFTFTALMHPTRARSTWRWRRLGSTAPAG